MHVDRESVIHRTFKGIAGWDLGLYKREDKTQCCAGNRAIANKKSARGGRFKFNGISVGKYWLVLTLEGKQHLMEVNVVKSLAYSFSQKCSDNEFAVTETGKFEATRSTVVQ
jgi:hypothetical protein